ncbi:MAG: hypothetical protein KY455_04150 [Euryarchaeota archaeon]|nr:hypothetical protein [Euryarchaeota archaeon]
MSRVAFEWALRDTLQGPRGIVLVAAALIPTVFILIIALTESPVPAREAPRVAAVVLTTFVFPGLVALLAIVAGGTVLRQPLEDGTLVYFMTRPAKRMWIGIARGAAAGTAVGALAVLCGVALIIPLGQPGIVFSAVPGLFVGGFALGVLYGLILSLHRYALGIAIIHAVLESALSRLPFASLRNLTVSWHSWGLMGRAADEAAKVGVIPGDGGSGVIAILYALVFLAITGFYYSVRPFTLGVAEG